MIQFTIQRNIEEHDDDASTTREEEGSFKKSTSDLI